MTVTVIHPTNRPNFCIIGTGRHEIAFSYRTPIGFRPADGRWVVRQNDWGPTTGKHLNWLPGDKADRLSSAAFEAALHAECGDVEALS